MLYSHFQYTEIWQFFKVVAALNIKVGSMSVIANTLQEKVGCKLSEILSFSSAKARLHSGTLYCFSSMFLIVELVSRHQHQTEIISFISYFLYLCLLFSFTSISWISKHCAIRNRYRKSQVCLIVYNKLFRLILEILFMHLNLWKKCVFFFCVGVM